jgi:phosphate transport system substrate-binding protein
MNKNILKITVANLFLAIFSSEAMAREHIQIVGSSTMFPLITAVAEEFSLNNDFKTPVVESNGTGGGIQLFCAGVGDILTLSMPLEKCLKVKSLDAMKMMLVKLSKSKSVMMA